jgi:flagellar biosynthesis component FlhA
MAIGRDTDRMTIYFWTSTEGIILFILRYSLQSWCGPPILIIFTYRPLALVCKAKNFGFSQLDNRMTNEEHRTLPDSRQKDLETASKIELIKNLIFGENIQAYESEFELLKKDILNKKKQLEELIEAVRTDLRMAINDVSTDVNIRITELEDKIEDRFESLEKEQLDAQNLGDLLIELGKKVKNS